MAILSKKIHYRVSETVLAVLAILFLFMNITSAQAMERATEGVVTLSGTTLLGQLNVPSTGFPVAQDREPRRTMRVRMSFYTSDVFQTDASPCVPADGSNLCVMAEQGVVDAVAANMLRLGTTVRFDGLEIDGIDLSDKDYTVRDRMNPRYNGTNYVDLYLAVLDENGDLDPVASRNKARELGVKYVTMEIF